MQTFRPFAFGALIRTIVYVDGFNLYYRALKGTKHRWLDIAALADAVLPKENCVIAINYYTARVSGRTGPTAPARQHAYLRAISSLPLVAIHYGNFLTGKKWAGVVQPPQFRPDGQVSYVTAPEVAYVWKTEEKGSDVNLGAHLVRDAFTDAFDQAAVLTNDTDLVEPIRIVTHEKGLKVILMTPVDNASTSLVKVSSHVRHIGPYLGPCMLPDPVTLANGKAVAKPAGW